jgi:hypothetical protein
MKTTRAQQAQALRRRRLAPVVPRTKRAGWVGCHPRQRQEGVPGFGRRPMTFWAGEQDAEPAAEGRGPLAGRNRLKLLQQTNSCLSGPSDMTAYE